MRDRYGPTSEDDSSFRPVRQQPSLRLMEEIGLAVEGIFTGIDCVTIGVPDQDDRALPVNVLHVNAGGVNITYFVPTKRAIAEMRAETNA